MCDAVNGTILNPAISPKIKIWTAAIIINFIVKHHVLRTYQRRVLHKTLKITSMFVSRMTVATKLLKMCLSNILIDDEIFKRWKNNPGHHPFCKHIHSNGDVIKTQC